MDEAIRQSHKIRIAYADMEEEYEVVVHPFRTYSQTNGVYLIALCEQSGEVEYYRLERMTKVVDTGEEYRKGVEGGSPGKDRGS